MTKLLSEIDIQKYHRDGVHFPVDCFSREEASAMLARFEAMEGARGGRLPARLNQKPHLLFPWLDRLIRDTRILDPVEDLLGPNLLCWSSQFFMKGAHDPAFVSWHQDGTYWGLSSPDVVTAWIAFTPSVPESGNMRVVPCTHRTKVPKIGADGGFGRKVRSGTADGRCGRKVQGAGCDMRPADVGAGPCFPWADVPRPFSFVAVPGAFRRYTSM